MRTTTTRLAGPLLAIAVTVGPVGAVGAVGAGFGLPAARAATTTKNRATTTTAYLAEVGRKIHLHQDDGGGQGEEVQSFRPTERVQRFFVKLAKLRLGTTKIRWVFTAINTVQGSNIKVAEAAASSLAANQVTGNVSLPNDWPIGTYRAELFVDGKATARRDYVVTSPVREQRIEQFRVFLDDGTGGQGREVKTWASRDRRVHFRVTSDGLLAPSTKVVCVLRLGLNEVGTVRLTVPPGELQSNYVDLHFTYTKDWVAGSYSLAVKLDGREAGRARFIAVA